MKNIRGFDSLDPEMMVFTSEVVEWELEVRCFVLHNEIKTHSSYWRNNAFDTGPLSGKCMRFLMILFSSMPELCPLPLSWISGSLKEKAGL